MAGVLLAVDPGIRGCGVAIFDGGVLKRAAYVKSPVATGNTATEAKIMATAVSEWLGGGAVVNAVALEWPRIYASRIREGKTRADPNDLLALAGVDSALVTLLRYAPVDCFAPSDWKGQLKKGPCAARVRKRLSADELAVLEGCGAPASLLHNVLDAVGIGLHRLGRFDRMRVIA